MRQTISLLGLMLLLPVTSVAQDISTTLPLPNAKSGGIFSVASAGAKGKPVVLQPIYWLKTLIDSSAVATVDRNYIEQPKKACAVELRNEFSECLLKMNADYPITEDLNANMSVRTTTGFTAATGVWLGYRGYGLGLSKDLTHGDGSTFAFGAMGGSFGLNLRINTYRGNQPDVWLRIPGSGDESYEGEGREELDDPIKVRTLFLDGYYMFNGKHFSYAAAYDQSLIQRRSAGSLMAGVMYYHSRVAFDDQSNWPLVMFMRGVGKLKFTQACVGLGYAYNWVPARGWLISAQAMPMLQFYNKITAYTYDVILEESENQSDDDLFCLNIQPSGEQSTNNYIGLNFDARLSMVYNWTNFYLRIYGHYNRFRYSNDMGYGRMAEWRAYASLGFRF